MVLLQLIKRIHIKSMFKEFDLVNKITQRNVADLAKVSTGTVSRVINGVPLVSEEARTAVLSAIEQLGYIPNTAAQSLAQGKTRNILVAFLDKNPILPSTWQYELPILQAINDYLHLNGYSVQIAIHSTERRLDSALFKDVIYNKSIDGMILLTSFALDESFIGALGESGIPTVFIGNGPYWFDGNQIGSAILFDNFNIIQTAFNFLHSLGHERIGFITGSDGHIHSQIRLKAFTEILSKTFKDLMRDDCVFHGDYTINSGFGALYSFYKKPQPPTAIICANDLMAIGAMKAADELGLRVPQDISIVGFDNIEVASFYSPSLTSIKIPSYELGKQGAEILLESIKNGKTRETITLPTELIVRKSVSKLC